MIAETRDDVDVQAGRLVLLGRLSPQKRSARASLDGASAASPSWHDVAG
jgi:hypothetical protein